MYANPKGREYEFHEVQPEDVKDARFIIISLMMAERAGVMHGIETRQRKR